jgi:hypothetical protein
MDLLSYYATYTKFLPSCCPVPWPIYDNYSPSLTNENRKNY